MTSLVKTESIASIMDEYGAYLVVKILTSNRSELLNEYECVPKSWVKVKDRDDNYVVFQYPLEDRIHTRLRVIEYQSLDKTWPILYGEVVFNTDSQDEAFQYLKRTLDRGSDCDQSEDTNKQDDEQKGTTMTNKIRIKTIKSTSKKANWRSKRKHSDQENIFQNNALGNESKKPLELILFEADQLIRTYASGGDNEKRVSTSSTSNNIQTPDTTQILSNETDNGSEKTSVRKENTAKITARPRRQSTLQNLSYSEYSDEEFERSEDSDYAPDSVPDEVLADNNLPDQDVNMSLLNDKVYSNCYNFYVEFNESYQTTMSILDNATDYLQRLISKHEDADAAKAIQSPSPKNQQPDDAIHSNMFSHPQPLLQERPSYSNEDAKWTLRHPEPESYNSEDAKWTLRHPEPGHGIIELLPNSGVYVSEKGLKECKSHSFRTNKTTKFTRALLEEVFTDEALKICSFTGTSRKNVTFIKPALDLKARETLVDYVLQYSLQKGWKKANIDIIMSCIRNRLSSLNRIG